MRVLIFAALSASAFAAELSVQTSVQTIRDALNSVDDTANTRAAGTMVGRKMIVEHLLQSVESATSFDPTQRAVFVDAAARLQDILDDLLAQKAAAEAMFAALMAEFPTCIVSATDQNVDNLLAAANTARTTHTDCRDNWVTDHSSFMTECGALLTIVNAIRSGLDPNEQAMGCDHSALGASVDDADHWVTMVTHGHGIIVAAGSSSSKANYDAAAASCQSASDDVNNRHNTCNSAQSAYETAYCDWGFALITRCNDQYTCYDNKLSALTNAAALESAPSASRIDEARAVTWVKCLCSALDAAVWTDVATWLASCDTEKNANYDSYGTVIPTAPDAVRCDYPDMWGDHQGDWDYDTNAVWFPRLDTSVSCNHPAATHNPDDY